MTLASGTRLGPYEILEPLGAGGMGEVYRARDSRLRRDIALKVLPEAVVRDPESLARLEREAHALAALSHPNIVVIHSIESDGDIRFITMELVEGRTLDGYIVPDGLPLGRLLDFSIPLTEALAAAHAKGVVHRDLKPANVVVAPDGRVKVLDFGLAKVGGPEHAAGADRTRMLDPSISVVGQVAGTIPYMAPEQLRGEAVDARTDLFALGIMMYELATGRRPFAGATQAVVISAILRDAPATLTNVRADLPLELERIIGRCLEKTPRDRFQTAIEVREGLARLQRGVGRSAAAQPNVASETPSIAVLPFANMSADPENEYFSDGLSEELLNALTKIPELKVTGRTSSFAFKGKQEDLRHIGQKLGVGTLLEGSVRKAGNRVRITAQLVKASDGFHLWSETYDRVLDDIFAVQDDIARSVSSALHVTLLGTRAKASKANATSYQLVLRGKHFFQQNTQSSVAKAVSLYEEAIAANPDDAPAWAGLAKARSFQAGFGYADPVESARLARDAGARALALDDGLADAHEVMGMLLGFLEFRWKEGMEELRRARELAPGASGPMASMSQCEGALGRIDESLRLARLAQEVDPLNAGAHVNRARVEQCVGNWDAACEAHLRALELSPGMTTQHMRLGLVYLYRGQGEEAVAEIKKETTPGYREHGLTIAYHSLGMQRESDASLVRLHEESDAWAYQFAGTHASRGEIDEAFRWLERAYELRDSGVAFTRMDRNLMNLHADPRWPAFLEKTGLAG